MKEEKGLLRVLRVLQGGGKYTSIDLVRGANVADPYKRIKALRDKGHNIKSEWQTDSGKRYKVWFLQASTPQQ